MVESVREKAIPEDRREAMNDIAELINRVIPEGTGFTLLVFDYGGKGEMSYISNAERPEMLVALKEFIAANEGRSFQETKV